MGTPINPRFDNDLQIIFQTGHKSHLLGGHIQYPICSLSKFFKTSGYWDQCYRVHWTNCKSVVFAHPASSVYNFATTSKYLVGALRLCLQISTPNMKFFSGDVFKVVSVGFGLFSVLKEVVRVFLFRVSKIMLAKPMTMATMIPIERIPPVKVLYSPYFWNLRSCVE